MKTNDFRVELIAQIDRARKQGRSHAEINAGELHRVLGGYPNGGDHRMSECCRVMKETMKVGDDLTFKPKGGEGASLTIRFKTQPPEAS
jgi:proline racemase